MNQQPATSIRQPASSLRPPASGLQTLFAFFLITRPLNVAIAGLSIFLAAILATPAGAQSFHFNLSVVCAILSGMLIAAGANVINDLCDVDIDKINRPQRVLPSGKMTQKTARRLMIFLFACGNFFSIFINWAATMVAAATSLLLIVYSVWLKRQPLSGNFAVSAASALAFIYGALAVPISGNEAMNALMQPLLPWRSWTSGWRAGIFPAVFSFLFHFGREVIKDIEDQSGDRTVQARTLPLAYGLTAAQIAATISFVLLMVVMPVPYHFGIYNAIYLRIVLCGVDFVLIIALYFLWKQPAPHRLRQISGVLKADMLVGLAAIYFGR